MSLDVEGLTVTVEPRVKMADLSRGALRGGARYIPLEMHDKSQPHSIIHDKDVHSTTLTM